MSIDPRWGDTDSGGSAPPRVGFAERYAGVHEAVELPAEGYAGLETDWIAERLENTAADDGRTLNSRVIGYRGVFTVRYNWLDAEGRRTLARLVNLGDRVFLQPHADAPRRFECWITGQSLDAYQQGRAVGYGPCALSFTTRRLYPGLPINELHAHFADIDEGGYGGIDEVAHFAAVDEGYTDDDDAGHFTKTEV